MVISDGRGVGDLLYVVELADCLGEGPLRSPHCRARLLGWWLAVFSCDWRTLSLGIKGLLIGPMAVLLVDLLVQFWLPLYAPEGLSRD